MTAYHLGLLATLLAVLIIVFVWLQVRRLNQLNPKDDYPRIFRKEGN